MLKSVYLRVVLALIVVVAGACVVVSSQVFLKAKSSQIKNLELYFPFGFSDKTDPRAIFTVGDQVLCDHLFAYHIQQNERRGALPVISAVEFDQLNNQIRIKPRYKIKQSDGKEFSPEMVCESLREAFKGTQHAPFDKLLNKIECSSEGVVIYLESVPVNMQALFTLPDFSIYNPLVLPLSSGNISPSTGPYMLTSLTGSRAELKRNIFYPEELTGNSIDDVAINRYKPSDVKQFLRNADPSNQHLLYFFGQTLDQDDVQVLKDKNYQVELFPSEWMFHIGFQPNVLLADRVQIGRVVDSIREEISRITPFGQPAYSIPPSDRPFGVDQDRYNKIISQLRSNDEEKRTLSRKLTVGTMDYWYSIPAFRRTLEALEKAFPLEIDIKILTPAEYSKLYESGIDVYLSIQGISAADPVHHLAFFLKSDPIFSNILTKEKVVSLAIIENASLFNNEILKVETSIIENRITIPIMHFPGVIAVAPGLSRVDELAGNWGLQAWTYRLR